MRYPTAQSVREAVAKIAAAAGDYEIAHEYEDQLHVDVLATIANGEHDDSAADLAREALRTGDIEFARYCA
jgi:hypothetical protein